MPYYPKENALRELTQLYSFTSLKVIQNHPHTEKEIDEQDNVHHENQNQKQTKAQINLKNARHKNTSKRKKKQKSDRKNYSTRTNRKIKT